MENSPLKNRILKSIIVLENGCWNWKLSLRNGYGRIDIKSKKYSAHRVSYEEFKGEKIPFGMEIDHKCKNKACVNPEHLEIVTRSENVKRSKPSKCPKGHEYTDENTYFNPARNGFRQCKKCDRNRKKIKQNESTSRI